MPIPAITKASTKLAASIARLHSIFGASKVAADVMAQEYGRYFGLNVGVFRGGCLTGPNHSGVELHGFLSYLVKVAFTGQTYNVFGYKGKQVRDNIHSHDVMRAVEEFCKNPRPGEVYNLGGGRENSVSVLEAIDRIEEMTGQENSAGTYRERRAKAITSATSAICASCDRIFPIGN